MPNPPTWNWQHPDWPRFQFERGPLEPLEAQFFHQSGLFAGSVRHVSRADQEQITVELMGEEAFHSSEIEGELLNRDSLQSSIRRNLGLASEHRRIPAAEAGVAEMMVELYRQYNAPLTEGLLFRWHTSLMNGRRDLALGAWRTGTAPLQVVSDTIRGVQVHF
jgi:Fic family protein